MSSNLFFAQHPDPAPRGAYFRRAFAAFAVTGALAATTSVAHAGGADDPDVQRLNAAGHSVKSNVVPAGKSVSYGHAEVLVNASMAKTLQVVTDIAHYKDLVPNKFQNARVIAK